MVAGHLQEKKGYFYIVLNYKDHEGKRKTKWLPTGLTAEGNKKMAEVLLNKARKEFVVESPVPTDDMSFHAYLEQWVEIAKSTIQLITYSSYLKSAILPHFKEKDIKLTDLKPKSL